MPQHRIASWLPFATHKAADTPASLEVDLTSESISLSTNLYAYRPAVWHDHVWNVLDVINNQEDFEEREESSLSMIRL